MAVKQQEIQRSLKKTKTPVIENLPEPPDTLLSEANEDVKLAFNAFINAKTELTEAVKEQEEQGKTASINSEKRYRAYREIIERAFKEKETVEQQAMAAYRESVEKAGKLYCEIVLAALERCKLTTDKAWENSLAPLKVSPTGEKPPAGTWVKTKNAFSNTGKQIKQHTIIWFNKAKLFVKTTLLSDKPADAESGRIK